MPGAGKSNSAQGKAGEGPLGEEVSGVIQLCSRQESGKLFPPGSSCHARCSAAFGRQKSMGQTCRPPQAARRHRDPTGAQVSCMSQSADALHALKRTSRSPPARLDPRLQLPAQAGIPASLQPPASPSKYMPAPAPQWPRTTEHGCTRRPRLMSSFFTYGCERSGGLINGDFQDCRVAGAATREPGAWL